MNREELEFERINRKLDEIFDIVISLKNKFDDMSYEKQLKELEAKAEDADREVQRHRENRRYMEESRDWDRKAWYNIEDHYRHVRGEIKDDRCYPVERLDVEAPEVL